MAAAGRPAAARRSPTGCTSLCSRGYAIASVDYRLSTVATWPAQIQDVKGAVRWLRANAGTYGLDPGRFGAWGDSAGGHLASLLGTSGDVSSVTVGNVTVDLEGSTGGNLDQSSRVQAVVDWYGATDFLQMRFYPTTSNHDSATSDESRVIGGAIQSNAQKAATANPIQYITADDPPFLVMHGTLDKINPFNQAELLVDALRAAEVPVTFRPVQGAGHGGSLFEKTENLAAVYGFFDAVLVPGPAPTLPPPPPVDPVPPGVPAVTVTATDATAAEPGTNGGVFTVTRSGSPAGSLTVSYTVAGTAAAGEDYTQLAGSVTIPPGQASATIPVAVLDDAAAERAETVLLTLEGSSAYAIGGSGSVGVDIADEDFDGVRPVVSVALSDPDAAEPADSGELNVWRTGSTAAELTVDLTSLGTAVSGIDVEERASVTFPAGVDRVAVKVTPIDDWATEDPETAGLAPVQAAGVLAAPYTGSRVTLADDDPVGSPELVSVALSPTEVPGTQSATGTVTLDSPALAGGAVVTLSSAVPGAASVPASVTVPQGATSATFIVKTQSVATTTAVDIHASRRGRTRTAALTVKAPAISGLTLTPSSLPGGCKTSTGKVTLTGKAPAGGLVVPLTNTNPAATVPASVTVAAGATSATFTIATATVTSAKGGTVTASYGGVSKSANLNVRPVGLLSLALAPNPVTGPNDVTGTVTLECPAAPGDIVVTLTTSAPSIAQPAVTTLTIPAGSSTGTFTVWTADVLEPRTASIKAAANGTAKSVTLTVR